MIRREQLLTHGPRPAVPGPPPPTKDENAARCGGDPGRARLAVALGGGGARGLAHIGALQVLEEEGIPVAAVAGTSMGALVGGAFAAGADLRHAHARIQTLLAFAPRSPSVRGSLLHRFRGLLELVGYVESDLFTRGRLRQDALARAFEDWVGRRNIEDLSIPFAAVAVDAVSGEEVVLDRGPLSRAVLASASLPGVYMPAEWHGRHLLDGGAVDNLPVEPAQRLGADLVLAISVEAPLHPDLPKNGFGLLARADQMGRMHAEARALGTADVALTVGLPDDIHVFDFERADAILAAGRSAMRAALPRLNAALEVKSEVRRIVGTTRAVP